MGRKQDNQTLPLLIAASAFALGLITSAAFGRTISPTSAPAGLAKQNPETPPSLWARIVRGWKVLSVFFLGIVAPVFAVFFFIAVIWHLRRPHDLQLHDIAVPADVATLAYDSHTITGLLQKRVMLIQKLATAEIATADVTHGQPIFVIPSTNISASGLASFIGEFVPTSWRWTHKVSGAVFESHPDGKQREFRIVLYLDSLPPVIVRGNGVASISQIISVAATRLVAAAFREAIQADRLNPHLHMGLANLWFADHRYILALSQYRLASMLRPDDPLPHVGLGNVYRHQRHLHAAIKEYRLALKMNGSMFGAYVGLGNVYDEVGNTESLTKAANMYLRAVHISPGSAQAHSNLCDAYGKLKKLDKAEYQCRLAVRYDVEFGAPHNNLGDIYRREDKFHEAVVEYDIASEISQNDYNPLKGKGLALLGLARGEQGASRAQALRDALGALEAANKLKHSQCLGDWVSKVEGLVATSDGKSPQDDSQPVSCNTAGAD